MMKKLWFLVFLILISGCIAGNVVKEVIPEPEVYFCPKEDCSKVLISLINESENIKCALYNIDLDNLIELLKEKKAIVVLNERNYGLMHNKFCVLDGNIVVTGSFNPTKRGLKDNNNLVVIKSKYLAENYLNEFNELKNNIYGKGSKNIYPVVYLNGNKWENYFCPDDNCKEKVIGNLNEAEQSIYFMVYSFTDSDIADLLIEKSGKIDVKGVLEKQRINLEYNQFNKLKENKVNVKPDKNKYLMHNKVFIIDNKTVITGSLNPTENGFFVNDENILIIHDEKIAEKYLDEFSDLFN